MDVLRDKKGRSNIRLIILVFVVLTGIVAALLYFPPILTRTTETRTSGEVTFTDGAGNLLSGTVTMSVAGAPQPAANAYSVSWDRVPNAGIYFDALAAKSIAVNFRISGDSHKGKVMLENYAIGIPNSVNTTPPGILVKYVEINATGISFSEAEISIKYTNEELNGVNESSLVIYRYDNATQAWSGLATGIDANNNIAGATVNSLSVFALSTRMPEQIEVRDTKKMPVISNIKTYDEAKNLKKAEKTNVLLSSDVPEMGELEVDALASKNVAVKLKVKAINKGEIVLDDFGKNNPVSVPLPGRAVKYVEIGANNISFSSADITIRYTDAELDGGSESELKIYHWNGASWEAVPTIIDTVNKTLSASTESLSFWGVATLYRQALRCSNGVSLGTDTTDSACGSSYTTFRTAELLAPTGTTSSTITFTAFTGEQLYAYFVNNTAFSSDVNVTGINGSISMDDNFGSGSVYGKLGLGYYDPNGAADNFVGLFNSTETSAVSSSTRASYPVSFNNQYGTIPANMKLSIRVWMRTTASMQPRFYTFRTTAGYDSSINITIAYPNASISGYVTNKTSGLPLSGANVTTNTSEYSITDATGYYIITGLSNGTYYVNASLDGYVTNSTIKAISGSDVTNYNITLSSVVLSGYVKDKDSGATLSGATVMTNTSNTTITDATGYYSFTGILNGTYIVNASLSNYATNSTNVTINNANVTNANITLLRAYLLSGYVTNASSGAAINGANVTTNTSQTTSTNATGYYNFTLSNGTYLITASNTSYSDNSTTRTVNGAAVSNVNITLTPTQSVTGQILVATNRFVILDDPTTGTPDTASGFSNMALADSWGTSYWVGINTIINATALYIDDNGFPVSNKIINFTLYRWDGVQVATVNSTTNSLGLANFSYDLNANNYYGNWRVQAANGSIGANTTFIYNWWGCAISGTNCNGHGVENPANYGTTTANSPYLSGRDTVTQRNNHYAAGVNCTFCHQSFDGLADGVNPAVNHTSFTSDVHRNIRCDNVNCHGAYNTGTNQHNTNQVIYSCYNSGCHGNASAWDRKDISNKSTLNSGTVSTAVSIYSYNNASTFNATFHTPNSTVPCIICHGPMHNITKPNATQRFTRNQATESEQCTACHSSYNKHNNTVNCTLCHSDDVHAIKVFDQNATYVNLTRSAPNPARGNCTNCHQNSSFFAALNNTATNPKVGNYSGRNPPIVAVPLEHSNDSTAGAKWKQTYWTNSDQLTWCVYCHSNTTHSTVALGRPANWDGNNIVNSSLAGNTTWCSGCHWQGYANGSNTYNDMASAFTGAGLLVPPEITGNATYGANISIYEYTNHSLYTSFYPNLNDSACNRCHGYRYGFTTITQLMHNQSRVGGANCVDCHDIGGIALLAHVNVTAANDTNAIHKNLNKNASGTNSSAYYNNSKRCWACHSNGSEPTTPNAHPTSYKMPENCTDCHIQSATQNFNFTPNNTLLNVSEHYWNATEIHTPAVATCYACHNKSEMLIAASDPDAGSGAVYGGANGGNNSTSHYGKKRADLRNGINATCTYCHQNASTVFATAMLDPSYNSSISNHSLRYNSSNPACTSSQCHSTGWIHNSTLTRPSLTLPNSAYCTNCHGSSGGATINNLTKHNNSVDCSSCHLYTARDIHPAKYLQPNSSYNTSNSTAVNCITCHQTGLAGFSNAPMVPDPMHHSDNASNGTLWNTTGYWTNNTVTSCTYCHNDTKHNATALGRPAYWKGDNAVNSSITSASNWCAGCHYRGYSSGAKSYNDMTSAFTTANLPVPPEITNGTYAPYDFSRYYNHSLTNYTDAACKPCHGINLTSGKITAFVHNITWGSCTDCHYSFSAMNITTRPDRYVNSTMFNASPHGQVACSNCHTKGHKNIGARKACEDCHAYQQAPLTDRDRHNITGAPGSGVVANTDCTSCHDATLYNNAINNYGYNKTRDCDYCHTYPDKTYS